jgi:hypothetical protein
MKVRTGFVSNSSSSSFVLIVTKDEFDKVRDKEDPIGKAILDATMFPTKVFGQSCMMYESFSNNGGIGTFYDFDTCGTIYGARELAEAEGRKLCVDENFPSDGTEEEQDNWLYDYVNEGLYDVRYSFGDVPEDKKWSHRQGW